jgi:magnesium-transporting ATPase (P-type)
MSKQRRKEGWIIWLALALGMGLGVALIGVLLRRRRRVGPAAPRVTPPDLQQFEGLTEEEAAARHSPLFAQERKQQKRRARRLILRDNIFSIFNVAMLGLALLQWLLGGSVGALLTLAVLVFNIVVNVTQQWFGAWRVERLADLARPVPTVIRESRVRSIDPDDMVLGDVLVIGPGDQVLADGDLLSDADVTIDESGVASNGNVSYVTTKHKGDELKAGSYCLRGWAVYEARALRTGQFHATLSQTARHGDVELTPLQRIIDNILRILLLLVALFAALLILDMARLAVMPKFVQDIYRDMASIFFSIAPSSLFFMVVVTYAMGSAVLGHAGALVRDSRAIEALSQVNVLCFGKTGTLTGAEVKIEMIPSASGELPLGETRVAQILGDYARSTLAHNLYLRFVAETFEGELRFAEQETRHFSAYGWDAATFSDPDLRGTYVFGAPDVLQAHLAVEQPEVGEEAKGFGGAVSVARRAVGGVGSLFKREAASPAGDAANGVDIQSAPGQDSPDAAPPGLTNEAAASTEGAEEPPGLFGRLRTRFVSLGRRPEDGGTGEEEVSDRGAAQTRMMFAYVPEPRPLFNADGRPQLPDDLIPLCYLRFTEQVRPEAREAVRTFTEAGVSVKILSSDDPDHLRAAAQEIGLGGDEGEPIEVIGGPELAGMDRDQLGQAAQEAPVFAWLTWEQKEELVRALREGGKSVAFVGSGIGDVSAMRQGTPSITTQSGSQAALNLADIILLKDSLEALPEVLRQGQRIVNGLLDILKINLTQISYVLLLLIVMIFTGSRIFFVNASQNGVILFFTVVVPSMGLTLFASAGSVPARRMLRRLGSFVVPAALTITLAVIVIDTVFFRLTGSVKEARLAATYGMIAMGLLLVVFVQPPYRARVGGGCLSSGWPTVVMAIVLFILYNILIQIPLAQELLHVGPLSNPTDYVLIGVIIVLWALVLQLSWRTGLLRRYVDIMSDRLTVE